MALSDDKILKGQFGISDLPYRRFVGFLIRFFKTFEVLLFKLLELSDIYRPRKTIYTVPSLVMPNMTLLNALVCNGTQDEVLSFKPRRFIHKIFKGLPDNEAFEKLLIELQYTDSDDSKHFFLANTENRGFVSLEIPHRNIDEFHHPKLKYIRIKPLGVETLLGTILLGDYDIYSSPAFFLSKHQKWVVISDIDDTIKNSDIQKTTSFTSILKALVRGHYYTYEAVSGMDKVYRSISEKNGMLIYLTSTPFQLGPFLLKFLRENKFPEGPVFLRWLGYGKYGHKWRVLTKIISNLPDSNCILIGDSGEQDLEIYRRIRKTHLMGNREIYIFIRHIAGTKKHELEKPLETSSTTPPIAYEQYYSTPSELAQKLEALF